MSPRREDPEFARERIRLLWANEGQPMHMGGRLPGVNRKNTYRVASRLGFQKARQGSFRGQYATGPCVECLVPHERDQIDEDLLCPSCRTEKEGFTRMPPLAKERTAKRQPRVHVDYEFEREQSRKRMQERFAGRREPLGQPRTPVSRVLKNSRMG